jgi:RNA polymerase sigma factor (sigma-70 family)
VLARDRKAGADFVRLYSHLVYRYVAKRLAPRLDLAEDLTQDIMLASWTALKSYTGEAPLAHWLLGIARFKVQDYYRAKLRHALRESEAEAADALPDPGPGVFEQFARDNDAARAAEVLRGMREDYALLLRWRYWDGLSASEMAAESEGSIKSVERMLQRARQEFRRLWLAQEGGVA